MKKKNGCLRAYIYFLIFVVAGGLFIRYVLLPWIAPTIMLHYRLDVTIEADGKIFTGSSVQELTAGATLPFLCGHGFACAGYGVRGQAVTVDIPGRGTLFVLMSQPPAHSKAGYGTPPGFASLFIHACGLTPGKPSWAAYIKSFKAVVGPCDIHKDQLPIFVRFRDEREPTSVEQVDPDDLAASFGPGVRFVGAQLSITDELISTGIEKRLPWLEDNWDRSLDNSRATPDLEFASALKYRFFRNKY